MPLFLWTPGSYFPHTIWGPLISSILDSVFSFQHVTVFPKNISFIFSWIRELLWFSIFGAHIRSHIWETLVWSGTRADRDPTTGSTIKNVPSRKAALWKAQRAVRTSDLSNHIWHFTPRTRKSCPSSGGGGSVVSHCVIDTCLWGYCDLASNWAINQGTQRTLFSSKRENTEQGA